MDAPPAVEPELRWLNLALRREVVRLRSAGLLTEDELRGLYVDDRQVDALIADHPAGTEARAELQRIDAAVAEARSVAAELRSESGGALARLGALFDLSAIDIALLVVGLAPELDLRYQTLYAYVQNDVTRKLPTLDLALRLAGVAGEEWIAGRARVTPGAPLAEHDLIHLEGDAQAGEMPELARYVRPDPRVVDLILGIRGPDRRLARVAELVRPDTSAERLDLEPDVAAAVARAIRALDTSNAIVELRGPRGAGKRAVASAMAAELGRQLLVTDLTALASAELPPPVAIRLLRREARMAGALLLLSGADTVTDEAGAAALAADLRAPPAPTLLASRGPWSGRMEHLARGGLEIELSPPGYPARRRLWTEALDCDGPDVDIVAGRYVLTPGQIADAATLARHLASGGEPTVAELQEAARVQAATRLRDLAEKIEPRYGWDDIVLPAAQFEQMREIQDAIAHRHVVYGSWGFDRKLARGRGVTALFVGPSGTGKTMGAEVLAYELSLDLYRIDLAGVVSKYIGETEKNISRIFEEARTSNAILFFDEADALFGKRSEVRDAHDRYANIEVAHLLQEMESYEGIAILATNLPGDLDEAFARRLHHSVEFPFPDAEQRQRIWERVFPPEAPLDDGLDFAFLAGSLELSGGNIRNVALTAAFRAAASSERITMEHVLVAAARELRKIGELPSAAQFGEYAELAVLP